MNQKIERPSAEVHNFPRRNATNAFEQTKQELAAFKFALFETVAADPLLRAGQCLNLIVVYASLVTIDRTTLMATTAYASNNRIYVRAGLRSAHTAIKARRLLEQHGYLVPVGKTRGMTVYRLDNPHQERVQMHGQETEEIARERNSDTRSSARKIAKTATPTDERIADIANPENHKDCIICTPRVAESASQGLQEMQPITLKEYLTGLPVKEGYEESDGSPVMGDAQETVSEATNKPALAVSGFSPQKKKTGTRSLQTAMKKTHPFPFQHPNKKPMNFCSLFSAAICIACMNAFWTEPASA